MTSEILVKLVALRNLVEQTLEGSTPRAKLRPPRNFDPKEHSNLFTRFSPLRDKLLIDYPSLFEGFPIREFVLSGSTDFDGRGYIKRRHIKILLNDIENCIDLLSGFSTVEVPSMKVTREGVFFAGQYYDALKSVRDIFSNAKRSIAIIDGYIDEQVLDILTEKNANVEVKILTKKVTPALLVSAQRYVKQYGKLSIRTSGVFHDRFVIIDNVEYYHFGASIKDLGNRGFMFSRIEEPSIIKIFSASWNNEWNAAKVEI